MVLATSKSVLRSFQKFRTSPHFWLLLQLISRMCLLFSFYSSLLFQFIRVHQADRRVILETTCAFWDGQMILGSPSYASHCFNCPAKANRSYVHHLIRICVIPLNSYGKSMKWRIRWAKYVSTLRLFTYMTCKVTKRWSTRNIAILVVILEVERNLFGYIVQQVTIHVKSLFTAQHLRGKGLNGLTTDYLSAPAKFSWEICVTTKLPPWL